MDRYIDDETVKTESFDEAEKSLIEKRRKNKRKKIIKKAVIWAFVLIFVVFGLFAYNYKLKNSRWPWQKEVVKDPMDSMVKTKVYESIYETSIDVSGSLSAYDTQNVMLRATGSVTGVFVEEGDKVTKGQLLATVDNTDQSYTVADIEKQIESAKISGQTSKRDIELLEMRLDSAKQKLDNTKAYANFDGVVVSVKIDKDDYYEAGSTAMTIIDNSRLKTTVEVDEIDILMLKKGAKATLTSDSCPGETIEAYVSYIPMIGRYSNQGIGVMDVELVIDNPPVNLKPGFSFEGSINIEGEQKMLLVSQSAVTTSRGVSYVTKLKEDGTTERVQIQVKYLGENLYQIVGGNVKDGDTVVYNRTGSGFESLINGMMAGGMR